jgi:hypothetical protein
MNETPLPRGWTQLVAKRTLVTRPIDMPLTGRVLRERKGAYVVVPEYRHATGFEQIKLPVKWRPIPFGLLRPFMAAMGMHASDMELA